MQLKSVSTAIINTDSSLGRRLQVLTIAFTSIGLLGARASAQNLDRVDSQRQDRQRIQITESADGVVFSPVGQENQTVGTSNQRLYLLLGVGADPIRTFEAALALSKATGRTVYPVMNGSGVVEARELWERRLAIGGAALDTIDPWLGESLRGVGDVVAEGDGRLHDAGRATTDRILPAEFSREPSTLSLKQALLNDLSNGTRVAIIAHSQGTVIAQNAVILVDKELKRSGQSWVSLDSGALSQVQVLAAGAYADPGKWPASMVVKHLNEPTDPIPKVGGSLPTVSWLDLDFSFKSHSFSGYVSWVAAELEGKPWCAPPDGTAASHDSSPDSPSESVPPLTEAERILLEDAERQASVGTDMSSRLGRKTEDLLAVTSGPMVERLFSDARSARAEVNRAFVDGCTFVSEQLQSEARDKFEDWQNFEFEPGEVETRILIQGCVNASVDLNESIDPLLGSLATALTASGADGKGFLKQAQAVDTPKRGEIGSIFWKVGKKIGKEKLREVVLREVSGFANRLYCTKDATFEFALKRYTVNNRIAPTLMQSVSAETDEEAERIIAQFESERDQTWTDFKRDIQACWSPGGTDTPLTSTLKSLEQGLNHLRTEAEKIPTAPGRPAGPSLRPQGPVPTGPPPAPGGPIPEIRPGNQR